MREDIIFVIQTIKTFRKHTTPQNNIFRSFPFYISGNAINELHPTNI